MFNEIGAPDAAHYEQSGETALSYLNNLPEKELSSLIVLEYLEKAKYFHHLSSSNNIG